MAKKSKNDEKQQITLQDLQNLRTELEKEAAAKQVELAQRTYQIDFENISNVTRTLAHLNKDVNWSTKNAALLVSLSDSLWEEQARLKAEDSKTDAIVSLKQVDVNTLYQSLLSVQSTGIESARNYVKLLTNIGAQITQAMQAMATANQEIQSIHVELAELDQRIDSEAEQATPTAEATSNSESTIETVANETI